MIRSNDLACHHGNGPEKEKDRKSAGENRDHVDHHCHLYRISESKQGKQPGNQTECRSSRGMANLKLIGGCNMFTRVPPAHCRFNREQVNDGGNSKNKPSDDVVSSLVLIHVKRSWYQKSFFFCKCKNIDY